MNLDLLSSETANETGLTSKDLEQLRLLGISPEEVRRQLAVFAAPPAPSHLVRPAVVDDGILRLAEDRHAGLTARFEQAMEDGAVCKFVPASGAATRMFRGLAPLLEDPPREPDEEARVVFSRLPRLAFFADLAAAAERRGLSLAELRKNADYRSLAELLLTSRGLGFANRPKGLIPFHRYPEGARTAFEEQLLEGAAYARDRTGLCRLHFTVSPVEEAAFRRLLGRAAPELGDRLGTRFDVRFSHQSHATDTLAVDPEDRPFRLEDGSLLFRPGGHGSLIGNLAALGRGGAEVVLIKNIDNVVPEGRQEVVVHWKKLLGGLLLEIREEIWSLLARLEDPASAGDAVLLDQATAYLAETLSRPLPATVAAPV